MSDYRGVTKVCSRCAQEGHVGKECNTPHCASCEVFGHETTDCSAPCRRCAEEHATADCLRPRSYYFAAGMAPAERAQASVAVDEPPTTPTEEGSTGPDGRAPSFTAGEDVSTTDSASQSSVSQDSSDDAESTDVPATKYESRPRAPSYSEAAAMSREGPDPKQTRGPAGRGHRMQTLDTRKRQPPAESPGAQAGPTALSPMILVAQCRDPSLCNPVSQVSELLGLSDDKLVDKPD
ncbi:hypothetical protein HPB49_018866 [Dermacentor silvarum]|uniref:Uncharacterized protein n=1 Tax=Dermacentor silvarum TaxID=543639 RepID=A0ACB8E2D4_DERSI|nr:hypothetical protein HPB49_018866 [Dermacentor silvarum]